MYVCELKPRWMASTTVQFFNIAPMEAPSYNSSKVSVLTSQEVKFRNIMICRRSATLIK